ncbi:hypothetical protein KI387_013172, partial [Taxus chinensis]
SIGQVVPFSADSPEPRTSRFRVPNVPNSSGPIVTFSSDPAELRVSRIRVPHVPHEPS